MAQEQLSGWVEAALSAIGGAGVALVTFIWHFGRRDKEIDEQIVAAETRMKEQLHEQRLYIDDQDRKNRHDMAAVIQQEVVKTENLIDKLMEKLEYHEEHDDKRFAQLVDRISDGFKDLSERIADLRVQVAVREAQRVREDRD